MLYILNFKKKSSRLVPVQLWGYELKTREEHQVDKLILLLGAQCWLGSVSCFMFCGKDWGACLFHVFGHQDWAYTVCHAKKSSHRSRWEQETFSVFCLWSLDPYFYGRYRALVASSHGCIGCRTVCQFQLVLSTDALWSMNYDSWFQRKKPTDHGTLVLSVVPVTPPNALPTTTLEWVLRTTTWGVVLQYDL